jgi:endonuclease III
MQNPPRGRVKNPPRMARESKAQRRARLDRIRSTLREVYPDAHCELGYRNPLELLVATILSAQCSDKQVNRVTTDLFRKYRTARDYAEASLPQLESDLRQIGLFRSKARSLQACGQALVERHNGEVPDDLSALVQLRGVGRKTANVVLGNAFGRQDGIVVDTHVARLARRLGLTRETQPETIERELMALVPRAEWTLFSHWLIWHGRRRCGARRPDCRNCELRTDCPTAGGVARAPLSSTDGP